MNLNVDLKDIKLDKGAAVNVYRRYRSIALYIGIIVVCILLVTNFLLPQVNEFLLSKDEEKQYEKRIQTLKGNIDFLNSLDEKQLDSQVETLVAGLPIEKDFAGIINAISTAAQKSGVILGDFSFSLGELSTGDTKKDASISIGLRVAGPIVAVKNFAKILGEIVPLADVSSMRYTGESATLVTAFLYRPPSSVKFNAYSPLQKLTNPELAVIQTVDGWRKNVGSLFDFFPSVGAGAPAATSSASPSVSPTAAPAATLTPTPPITATPTP